MSRSLRYQQPEIREHLASQYVLGTLSGRARRRFETLLTQDPELEARVYYWQDRMNHINDSIDAVAPPDRVWKSLQAMVSNSQPAPSPWQRFWNALPVWRTATALLLIVAFGLLLLPSEAPVQAVNYMAVMHSDTPNQEPAMVITAYKGDAPGRSHLHIQWNERLSRTNLKGLSLWAIDRETGERTSLGALSRAQSRRLLTKEEWLAVKQSAELWVIKGDHSDGPVLFRGPCLQLSPWEDRASPG